MTTNTVYLLFNAAEECLYIGCSSEGTTRLRQHSNQDWWPEVAYARFEHFDERKVALDRERQLIEFLAPAHNRLFHPAPVSPPTVDLPEPEEAPA